MPIHRNTTTTGKGASGVVGLAEQTSNRARCAVSSTGLLWQQGVPGYAIQGIDEWCVADTSAIGWSHWHSGQLFCWLPILSTPVVLATDKYGVCQSCQEQILFICKGERGCGVCRVSPTQSMACRQGSPPPHCWWVGGR
jgi:hypothetical protein